MAIGDCLNDTQDDEEVETVPIVSCRISHHSEVYDDAVIAGTEYPGLEALGEEADQVCKKSFAEFVGISYEDSGIDFSRYIPTEGSWESGDRLITCVARAVDMNGNWAQTTGTLKNARW
ncbi:septum formation family protein [Glaciihabitans sp. dw_435]|uniref:septum formation family protein n=1 Tax=Glaciihabitans sp. dw_435 TaxID=2720081 RepID=UPI001BD3D86C|nr:septum formation family protein [Glaciihabitans sp. dw_435]